MPIKLFTFLFYLKKKKKRKEGNKKNWVVRGTAIIAQWEDNISTNRTSPRRIAALAREICKYTHSENRCANDDTERLDSATTSHPRERIVAKKLLLREITPRLYTARTEKQGLFFPDPKSFECHILTLIITIIIIVIYIYCLVIKDRLMRSKVKFEKKKSLIPKRNASRAHGQPGASARPDERKYLERRK